MLSEDSMKIISNIFCGNEEGFYSYKTGPNLVSFFNQHFMYHDKYAQGFPSRWIYVYNKLVDMLNKGQIDTLFNLILSKKYIISDLKCTELKAIEQLDKAFVKINSILKTNLLILVKKNDKYTLCQIDSDLEFIASGGFANVYLQKSTGKVLKKLKEDYWMDSAIHSRFKREYKITKSLEDLHSVITVYDYDEDTMSYTMEKAEYTLEYYIENNSLPNGSKINCIRQILDTMKQVHQRNIIHRDISPNNIFITNGQLKIADFGLGKDLNIFTSHNTQRTQSLGQYSYCPPEQFMLLKEGDERSDVFSLGKTINFIMTSDSRNEQHIFKAVAEKATSVNVAFRYANAGELLKAIEKTIVYYEQNQDLKILHSKIKVGTFDSDVTTYISTLSGEYICKNLIGQMEGFLDILLEYMKQDPKYAVNIIQAVEDSFRNHCPNFEDYDPIAKLSSCIILDNNFEFPVKDFSATILHYIAYPMGRFSAQKLIKELIAHGVEPLIEEKLQA